MSNPELLRTLLMNLDYKNLYERYDCDKKVQFKMLRSSRSVYRTERAKRAAPGGAMVALRRTSFTV